MANDRVAPAPEGRAADAASAVAQAAADDRADASEALLDRKRDAIWQEVHDAFDTRTALVDDRAGGNPVGNPRDGLPTGPRSLPRRRAPR